MRPEFLLESQLCFRLYTASRLITQAYHPLLSEYGLTYPQYLVLLVLWEKDGVVVRRKGEKDGRQMIVSLTRKGRELQDKLAEVPYAIGDAVTCDSVNAETAADVFRTLDDIIAKLNSRS